MRKWRMEDARDAIARLDLRGGNRAVADYWLSLWHNGRPPTRSSFDPKRIGSLLPAIALLTVRPNESVQVKVAGNHLRLATGVELTGRDLLSVTPRHEHAHRIRACTDIVMGQVFLGKRAIARDGGRIELIDEICLPFAKPQEDGCRSSHAHELASKRLGASARGQPSYGLRRARTVRNGRSRSRLESARRRTLRRIRPHPPRS